MRRSLPSFEMLNPRNLRSSGRATSFLVRNRLTEAITRSPAEGQRGEERAFFLRCHLRDHLSQAQPALSARPLRRHQALERSPNGGQHSAGLVAALEGAERFALPPPPAIASVGTQEPMVRRPSRENASVFFGGMAMPQRRKGQSRNEVGILGGPMVRIRFPPAGSLRTIGS
jgi:hypothetical protein